MNIFQKRKAFDDFILITCFERFGKYEFTVPILKTTYTYIKLNHIYKHILELGYNRNILHDWGKYKSIHDWLRRSKPNIKELKPIKRVIPFQVVAEDYVLEAKKKELLLIKLVMD